MSALTWDSKRNEMTPLDFLAKAGQNVYPFVVHIYEFQKLTIFYLSMTWPLHKTS